MKRAQSTKMAMIPVVVVTAVLWLSTLGSVARAAEDTRTKMTIYATMPSSNKDLSAVARKQKYDLEHLNSANIEMNIVYLTHKGQRNFLQNHIQECGKNALDVYDSLQEINHHIQTEIFKWCAMATTQNADVVTYIDSASPILNRNAMEQLLTDPKIRTKSIAVMDDTTRTVHGSYMQLINNGENREFAMKMVHYITSKTDREVLQSHTVLIPRTIYEYIAKTRNYNWYTLQLSCRKSGTANAASVRDHSTCATGYCCSIQDTNRQATLLLSRNYILPTQMIPQPPQHHTLPNPFNHRSTTGSTNSNSKNKKEEPDSGTFEVNDIPFISTVSVKELSTEHGNRDDTPNFYQMLEKEDALPTHEHCTKCLREKSGATCETCKERCSSYCSQLCHTSIPAKPIVQEWTITPPTYSKHPQRLIPRIVHQTWFEHMDSEHYPNMSRLMESFKQSGWEYRFYTDQEIVTFLQIHFPPEVLQAYDALIPGAFKADLFRYCVLLIYGGVYADVDIQLQSALDLSIPDDVGFMVPVDEPGKPVHQQMCVWNGFIAAAPSHPFLVKAIETIVNQVRNRYTSVDIDATFCPRPELSVLHAYDTLFTAGPCMLGASINRVLGRNPQTSHVPGELHNVWDGAQRQLSVDGTSFVRTPGLTSGDGIEHRIPGRTIILQQNKWDMGAHRFTFVEQNIVVAATDLPDSNDRSMNILTDNENNENPDGTSNDESSKQQQHEHYSKAHAKTGVYGVEHLYYDRKIAHEEIRITIDATLLVKKQLATVAVLE